MTPSELRTLILSDATATQLAESLDFAGCAERCAVIAPPILSETLIGELGVFKLAADPLTAETVLQTIETIANSGNNPVVKRLLKWMQPGAPGVDFGDPRVRATLTAPVKSGGLGLSAEVVRPLLAAAETPQTFTAAEVKHAYRHGGN